MSTVNPLFLDSTKPVGDKVVTNVELSEITLQEGESLFLEVKDPSGKMQRFEMRKLVTKKSVKFKTEIWLKPQQNFEFRFVLEADGETRLTSTFRESLAGTSISEALQPSDERLVNSSKSEKKADRRPKANKTNPSKRDPKNKSAKDLFEPQELGAIKSLLDDLL